MRRLAVLAALVAAPVLSPLGSAAHADEPVWPDVVGIARDVVSDSFADGCLADYLIRPNPPRRYVSASITGPTVTVHGDAIVADVNEEIDYTTTFVDCVV